jgi:hypothetical protein
MIASPLPSSARPLSALVPSRRTTTGTLTPTSLTAWMMPSAIRSQRTMPPKMLTRIAFTFGLERMSLKASVTRSPWRRRRRRGSSPAAAVQLDQVHRRHRQAGAVDHAGDVAVERDVVEVVLAAPRRSIGLPGEVAQRGERLLAEQRVVLDVDLAVERQREPPSLVTISGLISTSAHPSRRTAVERHRRMTNCLRSARPCQGRAEASSRAW